MVNFKLTKAVQLDILKHIQQFGLDKTYQDIDAQLRLLLVQLRDSANLKPKIDLDELPW